MRGSDDMFMGYQLLQRGIVAYRLLAEYIESGPGQMSFVQGLQERLFVNQTAACAVDQARTSFHQAQLPGSNETGCAFRAACERGMQSDKIRLLQHFV